MVTISSILLFLLVLGLFIAMFYTCYHSTTAPSSITNLTAHLALLKMKFANHTPVDPQEERCVMESLQNRIKTACSQKVISGNEDIKALFAFNCQSINGIIKTAEPGNKTQWLQYGALMNDFNDQYFAGMTTG
jgi:hypothetical protein